MRILTASELLTVWEEGSNRPPYERALFLLSAACPEQSLDELMKLSVGQRDAYLLTLRESMFGSKLACITACPACGTRLEISVNVADVRTAVPESNGDEFRLTSDDYQIDFRLPCSIDLKEVSSYVDRESMRMAMIQHCILKVHRNGEEVAADQLPAPVVEAIVARMAEHDPQADTQFSLACPGCSHRWHAVFDIVSFFWGEIQAWALRILQEVHTLALAYGWQEADILAMSPLRRQSYLSMVGV